jgi:hypothetical protein
MTKPQPHATVPYPTFSGEDAGFNHPFEALADSGYPDDQVATQQHVSLCEVLDRVLTKGVVVKGDVVISVANVDLLYLGLQLVLCSADTAQRNGIWDIRREKTIMNRAMKNTDMLVGNRL